jgi:hypothetical protein
MADERKGYKYKEEHPVYNKFYSNAEDVTFYDAEPLTEEDHKKAAEMWDRLVISASPAQQVPDSRARSTKKRIETEEDKMRSHKMTIGPAPICIECKHYICSKGPDICEAFPEGIPDEILKGENKHKKPFPGDRGILFEPIKSKK